MEAKMILRVLYPFEAHFLTAAFRQNLGTPFKVHISTGVAVLPPFLTRDVGRAFAIQKSMFFGCHLVSSRFDALLDAFV